MRILDLIRVLIFSGILVAFMCVRRHKFVIFTLHYITHCAPVLSKLIALIRRRRIRLVLTNSTNCQIENMRNTINVRKNDHEVNRNHKEGSRPRDRKSVV